MDARQRLLERIGDINDFSRPRPLVELEEFFEGNEDPGSIGYNLNLEGNYVQEIYHAFKEIRARPDVASVMVEVKDQEDPNRWPSSDTIWVITSAHPCDLQSWLGEELCADEVQIGWPDHALERVSVPKGMRPLGVWWD